MAGSDVVYSLYPHIPVLGEDLAIIISVPKGSDNAKDAPGDFDKDELSDDAIRITCQSDVWSF
jgi:hypothetical protein